MQKFKVSVGNDLVHFEPITVTVNKLADIMTQTNYSTGIYKDNYRNLANFQEAHSIGLDVDSGITIDEAISVFKGKACVIAPSRSHRKAKAGIIADRFRVILPLESPITNAKDFSATWDSLQRLYPWIDEKCKDASRFYYPSTSIAKVRVQGDRIKPVKWTEPDNVEERPVLEPGVRGQLSSASLEFILLGKAEGARHDSLFKAAIDAHEQGYTQDEFWEMLIRNVPTSRLDLFTDPKSDRFNEAKNTIEDAFAKDPRYAPRLPERAFNLRPIGEVLSSSTEVNWLVDKFLTVGGISVIAGRPKSGKSTLIRQMSRSIARGEKFLDRECKQGPVIYLALEEQDEILSEQYKALGLTSADPIVIHTGLPEGKNVIESLELAIETYKPRLVVGDTMALLLGVKDLNSYGEANAALAPYRQLARRTKTHICLVHHSNKSGEGFNAISGSNAIFGAVDCGMLFKDDGPKRFLTTGQRGGNRFDNVELIFSEKTQTFALGDRRDVYADIDLR